MAKKTNKRKPANTSGPNKQEIKQQRLEARRQAKMEAETRRRKQQQRERLVRFAIISFIAVSLFWFIFLRNQAPAEIGGHQITQYSTGGVNDHTTDPQNYESVPGVSGFHAPSAAPCGIYGQQIPDETQVHMLEHGAVGVQFQPTLDPAKIEALEAIVKDYDADVFSAPYAELDTPISVTSWSRKMSLDDVDEAAIREYIDVFAGEGPEQGQTCAADSDQPFTPVEASPSPIPTPEAIPTPEGDGGGKKDKGNGEG